MEIALLTIGAIVYTALVAGISYAIGKVVGAAEQFGNDWRKEGGA